MIFRMCHICGQPGPATRRILELLASTFPAEDDPEHINISLSIDDIDAMLLEWEDENHA